MNKIIDIVLFAAAALFGVLVITNTLLANSDTATNQRLAQAQQYLQQHVPQARNNLQTLALRVNASAPQSSALKQVLDNLRLQVTPAPSTSAAQATSTPAFATGPTPTIQPANP